MPRPSKRKLQVASRKRNENGSFSEFQKQRQGSIENDDNDDDNIKDFKCCIVSFLLETLPRFTKLIGKINKSHVTHITQITNWK